MSHGRNAILRQLWRGLKLVLVVAVIGYGIYLVRFAPVPVTGHRIVRGEIVAEVMGTGTLEARVRVTISPKISGRIKEILADEGDRLSKGDVLVRLDDDELAQQVEIAQATRAVSQAAVERLRTDRDRAVAVADQAKREHQRIQQLISQNAITESELDQAVESVAIANAGLASADAAIVEGQQQILAAEKTLAYHRARLADTTITVPFDGLIVQRQRDPGDVVVLGSPILQLVSLDQLWISAWIDETQMSHIELGQPARVVFRSEPERSYAGEVSRLGKETDRETREFIVDVHVLELPENWAVGQRAEVYIETARKNDVPLLPAAHVRWLDDAPGVFVHRGNRAVWRPLKLGLRSPATIEVLDGLQSGETVVVPQNPKTELTDGKRIAPPMNLAVKDIRHNLGRFSLTTIGIGLLLMVVMGMGGIYRGLIEDATLLTDRIGADLWIVQRDTRGPFAEVSRVPANLVHRVSAVPGVATAREFVYHTIQREENGKSLRITVLGLSWPTDRGEWVPLIAGRPLAQNHFEMIADKTLGLGLGQSVRLGKDTYTVVGISSNMISSSGDGIGLFTVADAQAIQFDTPGETVRLEREARKARGQRSELGTSQPTLVEQAEQPTAEISAIARPQISAVMVRVAHGTRVEDVASTVSAWGDVSVHTQEEQNALLLKGPVEKSRKQLGLFRFLLTVIATVIMALILYTLTLDKLHSIALLKLIGAPNRVILGMILQQALVLGVLGYGIAYLLGQKVFPNFPRRVILVESDLIQLALIVLGISVLSSVLGIWRAMRVQPNEALG